MSLAGVNRREEPQVRLAELERKNQLLEAEVQQLRVYKDYAYTDVLTEVPNRRFYHERLVQEMARSRRGRHPLGLAWFILSAWLWWTWTISRRSTIRSGTARGTRC